MSTAVHITLDEFLARPEREDNQREELIEGEVILSPAAKVWHAAIVDRLREQLALLKQQGFVLPNDFACILGDTSMPAPDLSAVRLERWRQAEANDSWLEASPALVIEVASPSNRKLHRKAEIYLEYGAEQVWIVYRKTKTVTVITSEGSTEARIGEMLDFHGVQVPVASIFPNS